MKRFFAIALITLVAAPAIAQDGSSRLKDLVMLEGAAPRQLIGYGLITGLDRTGDRVRGRRGSPYTTQSIANMLERLGIPVDPEVINSRNTAAVMVTAVLDPFNGIGSTIDVTVSSLGDARSLSGGMLLMTPLLDPESGERYATAQGPVSTGSILASSLGSSVQVNHTNTGRIPNGAVVQSASPVNLDAAGLGLVLKRPDFTNAVRIADAINTTYPDAAVVEHAGLVRVTRPQEITSSALLLANLEGVQVEVDIPARVVINERTGTIVAGGNVRVSEVMVTYGSIVIATQADPFVSQPGAFSQGETVAGAAGAAQIDQEGTHSVVLQPNTDVNQLAAALNELGLTARDVIAIFQAIDRAGALLGELHIL
ncbi:MAG: flagellar basal body P-ring protein FlgI [Rhodothermales bacterium]|nr:flagellar basal body P-ring protein FlgI [Rhodothermales bacterium]MBO6780482.1 flagellar basal body P-ring protein FlgI [Rhodothermales bacterium]